MANPYLPSEDMTQYHLRAVKYGLQQHLGGYAMDHLTVDVAQEMFDHMAYRLRVDILQDQLPPVEVVEEQLVTTVPVPVTWWDHFKQEKVAADKWYWRWLGKLAPPLLEARVKTVTLTVDLQRWVSYPEAQSIPASYGRDVRGFSINPVVRMEDFE